MYKKIVLIFSLFFLLTSCWEKNDLDSTLIPYDSDDFSISIPANWQIIDNYEEILPKANVWEIELVASANSSLWGFSNNMLILSADLNKATTSKDYAMLNNIWAETDYLEYLKLSSKEIAFISWDTSLIYEFEAKYNYESPKLKFIQTALVCNNTKAYLITLALPTNVSDISKYLNFISTFNCK